MYVFARVSVKRQGWLVLAVDRDVSKEREKEEEVGGEKGKRLAGQARLR